MSSNGTTLAIRPHADAPARKINKIVPYAKGGFALIAPYHAARRGYLAKMPVDYSKGAEAGYQRVHRDEIIGFTADDRVKLSYHPDGFVQFSSETPGRVISGRDPTTGEPKGAGLITLPLAGPIRAGPTMGVTVWGLDDFAKLGTKAGTVVFQPEDTYYFPLYPGHG